MNSKSTPTSKSDDKPSAPRPILAPSRFGSLASKSSDSNQPSQPEMRSRFPVLKASKFSSVTTKTSDSTPSEPESESTSQPTTNAESAPVRFVPLSKEPAAPDSDKTPAGPEPSEPKEPAASSTETPSTFIFGENLRKRASNFTTEAEPEKKPDPPEKSNNDAKSSDFVFGRDLQERAQNFVTPEPQNHEEKDHEGEKEKTLSESAAEWSEARNLKRKYEEVAVVTGEENETNVIRMHAKLHVFDKATGSWMERGRGRLHLNDFDDMHSRLVMRTGGSLRVILNTKLFPAMSVEMPSEKNIRLTGYEGEVVKIFLITGSAKEMYRLYTAIDSRLAKVKEEETTKKPRESQD